MVVKIFRHSEPFSHKSFIMIKNIIYLTVHLLCMEELLYVMNPWWEEGAVPKRLRGKPRTERVQSLVEEHDKDVISILTGPRRTGKTTIFYQCIHKLIGSGVPPNKILYVELDHPSLLAEDLIPETLKEFRQIHSHPRDEKVYLFLDEIQHIEGWHRWMKSIYDVERVKLYLTGSISSMLKRDTYASLTGRYLKRELWPMDFNEWLDFSDKTIKRSESYLYLSEVERYLKRGGFPEVTIQEDWNEAERYLLTYFEDMIFKDIGRVREIRDMRTLEDIATFLVKNISCITSLSKMANTFKISPNTAKEYVDSLSEVYLFFPCPYFSHSVNERNYNPKKYYIVDTGLRRAVDPVENMGPTVENAVYNHLRREGKTYYWKDKVELGFYLPEKKRAVECKYKKAIENKDINGLVKFMRSHQVNESIVITEDLRDERKIRGEQIKFQPLWEFLLESGHH